MQHPAMLSIIILLLVLSTPAIFTWANTEKAIFTVRHAPTGSSEDNREDNWRRYHGIVDPFSWKALTSPHTIIRAEEIHPSFFEYDVTVASQRTRCISVSSINNNNSNNDHTSRLISEEAYGVDLQSRQFKWYVLEDLDSNASFELRISYPATSPADFDMKIWTLSEVEEWLPTSVNLLGHFPENTMFARIKATYTGVSYLSDGDMFSPETLPVPFNLVLERLYLLIPYQALKLAAVIVAVVVCGLGYVVPKVHGVLAHIAAEGARSRKAE